MGITSTDGGRLVTRTEIAALAGVKRPAVTNWARRNADFPKPVRSGELDYFRLPEVLDWLGRCVVPTRLRTVEEAEGVTYGHRARGNLAALSRWTADDTPTAVPRSQLLHPEDPRRVKALMGPLAARVRGTGSTLDYLSLLLSAVYLRSNDTTGRVLQQARAGLGRGAEDSNTLLERIGTEADKALRSRGVLPGMRAGLTRLRPRSYDDLENAVGRAEELGPGAFRLILDEYEARADLRSAEFFTPQGVARLVARLTVTDGMRLGTLFDPYLRGGELLAAVVEEAAARPGGRVPVAWGESGRQETLRFAAMSLTLQGVHPRLAQASSVPWESGSRREWKADVIVTNPPFNMSDSSDEDRKRGRWLYAPPPNGNDNFAWLQYVLSSLAPGGRAAVIMPNKAGNSSNPAEREIRRAMVEAGVVECVVALPANLFSKAQVPVSVWLLTSPDQRRTEILFLDAGHRGTRQGGRRVLNEEDLQAITGAVSAWRTGGSTERNGDPFAGYSAAVSLALVREAACSLNPIDYIAGRQRMHQGAPVEGFLDSFAENVRRLHAQAQSAAGIVDSRRIVPGGASRSRRSGALLREICEIQAGPSYTRLRAHQCSGQGEVPVVFPRHLRDGSIAEVADSRISAELAYGLGQFQLAAGDVLCVRTGAMGAPALVQPAQEGWLFSTNLLRLRVKPHVLADPDYLVQYLSLPHVVEWIRDRAASTAAPSLRADSLGHLPVVLPEPGEQAEIAAVLTDLKAQAFAYEQLAAEISRSRAVIAAGLIDGTFGFD